MSSGKKEKKYPYESPVIYELQVDLKQAMGQTQCTSGTYASGACSVGTNPYGSGCNDGARAQRSCANGNIPGTQCNSGGQPAM
jgi:hypothetical protein